MEQSCLLITGRLLDGQDAEAVQARMAQAFGMDMADFRQRVFERAPLVIRRGISEDAAQAQAEQLRQMGVEADVWPDDAPLVWLLRQGQLRGPLPESALGRLAMHGDQWCHDGGQQWYPWDAPHARAPLPPPLPEAAPDAESHASADPVEADDEPLMADVPPGSFAPPPLPPAPRRPISTWAVAAACLSLVSLLWNGIAPIALVLAVVCLILLLRRGAPRGRGWAVTAVVFALIGTALWLIPGANQNPPSAPQVAKARPLQPLPEEMTVRSAPAPAVSTATAKTTCPQDTVAPHNDEDRFLLTGGQRKLTGRSQRKGDTYVAEAAGNIDQGCRPDDVQLYVFRHGVFVGTALEQSVSQARARLADFTLSDETHLRVNMASCKGEACEQPALREFEVLHETSGWVVKQLGGH